MAIRARDIVPFSRVRAELTELADAAAHGEEKIFTRNGEGYVALIDARRLDYYHRLVKEHIHLTLLDEIDRGLADVEAGHTISVNAFRKKFKKK